MSLALFKREKHFTAIKNDLFLKTPFKPSQVGYLVVTNKYVKVLGMLLALFSREKHFTAILFLAPLSPARLVI